jgi:transcriptional regulator with XRE-family HTH domain
MMGLRKWRTQKLMSLAELAAAAGIMSKTLADLEHGRRTPNYHTMRQVSAALGVDAGEITEFAAALARRAERRERPSESDESIATFCQNA